MTTIACNREVMAGDTRLTDGNTVNHGKKVFKKDGHCIGIAGDYGNCMKFVQWWMRGDLSEDCPADMDEVDVLILTRDGRILHYNASSTCYELEDKFVAIGSGAAAAMGAMHAGASPQRAIKAASRVDTSTGGKVTIRRRGI